MIMSRSRKKQPYVSICCMKASELKKAKKVMAQRTRSYLRNEEDVSSGAFYKKWRHDYQWRPDDGRLRLTDDPKNYRK